MIIVKQSHFHCSRHYIIIESIHITPNIFHQPTLFHCTCVCSSWEFQLCLAAGATAKSSYSQELPWLQEFASGITSLQQTQLHQQLHVKSTVLHSFRIQILNSYCKLPCQVWHNQTLHKYSHFGNISLAHSFLNESKKVSLWHFQIFSILQSAFIKP